MQLSFNQNKANLHRDKKGRRSLTPPWPCKDWLRSRRTGALMSQRQERGQKGGRRRREKVNMRGADENVGWEGWVQGWKQAKIQIKLTNRWMWHISIHQQQTEAPCFMSRRVFGAGSKLKGKTGKGLKSASSLCVCLGARKFILAHTGWWFLKGADYPRGNRTTQNTIVSMPIFNKCKASNERRLISNKLPWRRTLWRRCAARGGVWAGQRSFVLGYSRGWGLRNGQIWAEFSTVLRES